MSAQSFIENWLFLGIQVVSFLVLVAVVYYKRNKEFYLRCCRRAVLLLILLRVGYAMFRTIYQYFLWSKTNPLLLTMPVKPARAIFSSFFNAIAGGNGYFLYHCFWIFWLSAILTIVVALILLAVISLVIKFDSATIGSSISKSEGWVLAAAALVAGWPQFIIMLIGTGLFSLIFFIIFSNKIIIQIYGSKIQMYGFNRLEWPIILATLVTLIFGAFFVHLFGISVLIV